MKRILEVFCGNKSISNIFKDNGYEVYTIDIDQRFNPTECIDILDFDYKKFDPNYFDYLHFSPPCQYMSQNQQTWIGRHKGKGDKKYLFTKEHLENNLLESDKLLYRCVDIINYFTDAKFTIENPHHTKFNSMFSRDIFDYDYTICNYCMYNHQLKKPTIFYNNFNLDLQKCSREHLHTRFRDFEGGGGNPYERYKIPVLLCEDIFKQYYKGIKFLSELKDISL